MTFIDYIIQERGRNFLSLSFMDMDKCKYRGKLEDWFKDMYYDYNLIFQQLNPDKEILIITSVIKENSKLGYGFNYKIKRGNYNTIGSFSARLFDTYYDKYRIRFEIPPTNQK